MIYSFKVFLVKYSKHHNKIPLSVSVIYSVNSMRKDNHLIMLKRQCPNFNVMLFTHSFNFEKRYIFRLAPKVDIFVYLITTPVKTVVQLCGTGTCPTCLALLRIALYCPRMTIKRYHFTSILWNVISSMKSISGAFRESSSNCVVDGRNYTSRFYNNCYNLLRHL